MQMVYEKIEMIKSFLRWKKIQLQEHHLQVDVELYSEYADKWQALPWCFGNFDA